MSKTEVSIPVKALTVNHAWRGGPRFKTKEYIAYEKEAMSELPRQETIWGWVEVKYTFGLLKKTFSITDVCNLEKPLSDILVHKKYIEDDRKIIKATLEKVLSAKPFIKIEIQKCDGPETSK